MKDSTNSLLESLVGHRPYLTRYAYSKLRHKGAAEDVVQEALMAAVEGQSRFKGDAAPLTWMIAILKHKIVDWQRREARNPARITAPACMEADVEYMEAPDELFDEEGRWVNPPSEWANPEQSFENQKFWEMLEGCLAELPAATARAFYLREIQGLETKEICNELGISESNCWVMLHRARLSLREKIGERWFDMGREPSIGEGRSRRPPNGTRAVAAGGHLAHSMG